MYSEVHQKIEGLILPIAAFMALGALGIMLGGIGYARMWMKKAA